MKKWLFVVLASMAATGAAQAQSAESSESFTSNPYLGIGVTGAKNASSGKDTANLKLFGGFKLRDGWGVESGWTHYGSQDFNRNFGPQNVFGSTSGLSGYVAGTYAVPLNDRFSVYGKLGLASSWRKYSDNAGTHYKDKDKGVYAALGAEFKLTEQVSLIAEIEHQGQRKNAGAKADVATVALKFGF